MLERDKSKSQTIQSTKMIILRKHFYPRSTYSKLWNPRILFSFWMWCRVVTITILFSSSVMEENSENTWTKSKTSAKNKQSDSWNRYAMDLENL